MSLEEIKQRKLQELQEKFANQKQEQAQLLEQVHMIESAAKQYLNAEAISRFGNIKAAHPEKAIQVAALIVQGARTGQIQGKLNDMQFKELLLRLQAEKKERKIVRKEK